MNILCLTKNIRGSFAEYMLKHYPSVILCYDVLGVFVGEGCGSTKGGVGNGLGECLGHDDVSLTGFFME